MEARIGHVTDARDTRPAFNVMYRRYSDTRSSLLRVQAKDAREAMHALTQHVGNLHYVVSSIREETWRQDGRPIG
jgi:hypothetical protein